MHTFVMASQRMLWAGASYRPRLYTDVVPIFVLLGVIGISATYNQNHGPSWQWIDRVKTSKGKIKLIFVVIGIAAGIIINGVGA